MTNRKRTYNEHYAIRKNLHIEINKKHTGDALIYHYLCSAITEWLDTGMVQVQKYPEPIRPTLYAQTKIGWYNMLPGQLSNK